MHIDDDNMRKKLGYLRRATTLYEKERFKEAFETILKAIKIIKIEIKKETADEDKMKMTLRQKLKLDRDFEINKDQILRMQDKVGQGAKIEESEIFDEDSEEDLPEEQFQKVILYAEKTGVIGEEKKDVNKQIKNDIEDMYQKIVKKLKFDELGIKHMKKKKNKLEHELEGNELSGYGELKTTTREPRKPRFYSEFCPYIMDELRTRETYNQRDNDSNFTLDKTKKNLYQFCPDFPNCQKAHKPSELDFNLKYKAKHLKQLKQAIGLCTNKLIDSDPITPWLAMGAKDTIENAAKVKYIENNKAKNYKNNSDDEDSEDLMKKKAMDVNFYENDLSKIQELPWDFKVEANDYKEDDNDLEYDNVYKKNESEAEDLGGFNF